MKVFQYGSNCDPKRLNNSSRLNGAATALGKAQTVNNYDLVFDVWSDSNKCAAANFVASGSERAWGILYEISDDRIDRPKGQKGARTLAQIEGKLYEKTSIEVIHCGQTISACTFIVKEEFRTLNIATSAAYVEHITKGLFQFQVPADYIGHVLDIAIANLVSAGDSSREELAKVETLRRPAPASDKSSRQ